MRSHWISLITLPALILAGCGAPQITGQNENPAPVVQETLSTSPTNPRAAATEQPAIPSSSTPVTPEVQLPEIEKASSAPRDIVEKAKADLVKQFSVSADQIRIREARAVDWPDASLGCPQPDMMYAQVITPGYWILLEADGKQYPYHTDQNEQIILCMGSSSNPAVIPVNPDEIDDGQPWVPVE
jgi:hypothetical protein